MKNYFQAAEYQSDLDAIAAAAKGDAAAEVRYASVVKSINNRMKKTLGLLDGFSRKDLAAIKDQQDGEFRAWYARQGKPAAMLAELDAAIAADIALGSEEFAWGVATNSDLLKSARTLHRLALEKQKPDEQRKAGFQLRDLSFIKARLTRLEQSYDAKVDQAGYAAGLARYMKLDATSHPAGLDALLPAQEDVPALYRASQLGVTAQRLALLEQE